MASKLPERLAARVRDELTGQGKTQAELAAHLDITQSMISRRLAGRYAWPLHELPALAEFFGTTVENLIGERAA